MKIKLVKTEDFEDLAVLFENNNVEPITRFFTPFALTRETAHEIACEYHRDKYYLGIVEEKVIGLSMLRGWDEGYTVPSFGMFIDLHQHRHGYGKQLLDLTIEAARQLGCQKIRLSVLKANHLAYRIYKSRGFKEIDRSKFHDSADEKLIMIKDLN